MNKIIVLLMFSWLSARTPDEVLSKRLTADDKRYHTMKEAMSLMQERHAKIIVETGTARKGNLNCKGDGCSTLVFGEWVEELGAYLFSVDIDPRAILAAQQHVKQYQHVALVCSDSISFLAHFGQPIDLLYLDSYDYEERNPLPSQMHHLKEIMAAYPWLTSHSVVMIDDCQLPNGGKGKLVIDFLLQKGWRILKEGYQVILAQ
jgi:predicted O-methyltransferase YrrM